MKEQAPQVNHERWHRQIEACFLSRLQASELDGLYAHLKSCDACCAVFERYSRAERALGGAGVDRPFTELERQRVQSRLFKQDTSAGAPSNKLLLGGFFATAIALGTVLLVSPQTIKSPADDMQTRGSDTRLSHQVSIRVLRVRESNAGPRVADLGAAGSVKPSDELRFVYTNLAAFETITLLIESPEGRQVLTSGHNVLKDVEDQPLGIPFRVPASWFMGSLSVIAVFSRAEAPPLDLASVPPAGDGPERSVRVVKAQIAGGDLRKSDQGRE